MNYSENIKTILLNLIVNKEFIKEYTDLYPDGIYHGVLGVGVIEKWCIKFYNKYKTPVESNIKLAYDNVVRNKKVSTEELTYIDSLLNDLNQLDETAPCPPIEYLMDLAVQEGNRVHLERMRDALDVTLEKNDIKAALDSYEKFKKIERGEVTPKISFITDTDKVADLALAKGTSPFLFGKSAYDREVFSQILHKELQFYRGRTKSKKSFGCFDIALNAVVQGKSVLIFELGDLSEEDSVKRIACALLKTPFSEEDAKKTYKVGHIDCYKNKSGECMNINRTCSTCYQNPDGTYNTDYKPCTACSKCGKPFPVTVTHTIEHAGKVPSKEIIKQEFDNLHKYLGDNVVFDLFSYKAGEVTASKIHDIVKEYYDNGHPIDLVVIDHFAQMKPEPYSIRMSISERTEESCKILRNIAFMGPAVLVADQASIRSVEGGTSNDMLSDADYTNGASKAQYAGSILVSNVQKQDQYDGTIKLQVMSARHNSETYGNGGYILVCTDVGRGTFNNESFYVTEEHIKCIKEYEEEHNINKDHTYSGKKTKK